MGNEGGLLAERYRLVSQAGAGAMGVVWKAQDERLGRVVAVKQMVLREGGLDTDPEIAKARVMREGRLAARLHQQHAIKVYDVVEEAGTPYLIMEYLESESLAALMARRGTLPPDEVARIGSQIAGALAVAHESGIVHRDVKPGNVLVADDGTAKITDFGISHAVGDVTMTATGIFAGTPAYLAPEVARGRKADYAADVFSLGATLYAAVEGNPPFGLDENALALVFRVASNEITPPSHAGPLTPVLLALLAQDPARRPGMRQAADALGDVAKPGGSTARVVPAPAGPTTPVTTPNGTAVLDTGVPAPAANPGTPGPAPTSTAPTSTAPTAPTRAVAGPPPTRYGPGPYATAGGGTTTAPPPLPPPRTPPQGFQPTPRPGGASTTAADENRRKRFAMIALAAIGLVVVLAVVLATLLSQGDAPPTRQAPRPQAPAPTSSVSTTPEDTGTGTTPPSTSPPTEEPSGPSQAPAPTTRPSTTPSPSAAPEPTTTPEPTPTETPSEVPVPTPVPTGP